MSLEGRGGAKVLELTEVGRAGGSEISPRFGDWLRVSWTVEMG